MARGFRPFPIDVTPEPLEGLPAVPLVGRKTPSQCETSLGKPSKGFHLHPDKGNLASPVFRLHLESPPAPERALDILKVDNSGFIHPGHLQGPSSPGRFLKLHLLPNPGLAVAIPRQLDAGTPSRPHVPTAQHGKNYFRFRGKMDGFHGLNRLHEGSLVRLDARDRILLLYSQ
jgi:hypothetical protein